MRIPIVWILGIVSLVGLFMKSLGSFFSEINQDQVPVMSLMTGFGADNMRGGCLAPPQSINQQILLLSPSYTCSVIIIIIYPALPQAHRIAE